MIHWFKRHPEFLRKESWDLAHDSNYQELFQIRDELFISHGYVVVRLDRVYKHPILIVYSPATPYILPTVYPLNKELTIEEGNLIASSYEIKLPTGSIKYHYNLRHQNGTGALCFIEWETFDEGGQYYGITSIIQRVRDWYKGHVTGEFPPDSQEVEFFSHFNLINSQFQLLYPETFVTSTNVQGEFYASQYFTLATITKQKDLRALYLGSYLTGVNKSGVSIDTPVDLNVPDHISQEGLVSSLDFQTKPDLVNRLVTEERLKKGLWFDVENEPMPFQNFSDLLTIIGNGSEDAGVDRLCSISYEQLKRLPDDFLIAIRFPNRKGIKEFQAFIARKIGTVIPPPLFDAAPIETMKVVVKNYDIVEAVFCEKFSEETFFQRNAKRANRNVLKYGTVNIIGVGALGSEIADSMAKAGIGNMWLIDNQTVGSHNIVRHLAGLGNTGMFKVDAVAKIVKEHNPYLSVLVGRHNVLSGEIATELIEDSISISSIADDNIENFINEQAVIVRRPLFYTRALRGGKVARIVRVIPGVDACLNCLRLYRQEESGFINIPIDSEFPTLRNECNNPILPASAADLKLIAALTSRLLIDYLQNETTSNTNHWLWSSEVISGTPLTQPFSVTEQTFTPHTHCQFCNDAILSSVVIESNVLNNLVEQVIAKAGTETGGVLAGYVNEDGSIFITHASGPGHKAIETPTRFEKDVEFCQKFLDDLAEEHGEKAVYLGEWHSHPNENNQPSNTDLRSLTDISNQKEYLTDRPVMIIFTKSGIPSCTIHPAGKIYKRLKLNTK